MNTNDLVWLLHEAEQELSVLASYAEAAEEDPAAINWPNLGLKTTAQAQKKLRDMIRANLAQLPVEEQDLRNENRALRAALARRHSNEDWRAHYLASQMECGQLRAELEALRAATVGAPNE